MSSLIRIAITITTHDYDYKLTGRLEIPLLRGITNYVRTWFLHDWRRERLLRAGQFSKLDIEHIAEEIEDMGHSQQDKLASHLLVLLTHLLKLMLAARYLPTDYERAAREEPANPMPHYYLGYLYKDRNQRPRAVQAFRAYLRLKPDAEERRDVQQEIEDLGG